MQFRLLKDEGTGRSPIGSSEGACQEEDRLLVGIAADQAAIVLERRRAESGRLLRLLGHEVHGAYDGLEAVESARALRPEVILLDIGLPKLDGYEAGRQVRQDLGDGVTLIALTGWGQAEDQRRSREVGFNHHLTKPVEVEALLRLLAPASEPEGPPAGSPPRA